MPGLMRILVNVPQPPRVERTRLAYDSMDFVTLREEKLGQIGTVLAGDSRNEGPSSFECFIHVKYPILLAVSPC